MEQLTVYIDGYCERLEPGLLAEPVNALTNFAFIIAAVIAFTKFGARRYPITFVLSLILGAIGVGSLLFHTFANRLTVIADVIPIALFVLTYLFATNRYVARMRPVPAVMVTLLFFPYSWLMIAALSAAFPWLGGSVGYVPIALMILLYSLLLWRRWPLFAKDLAIGFGLLVISISFRWLDEPVCHLIPVGTHFVWHILNAVMLAWMIVALEKHLTLTSSAGLETSKRGEYNDD